MNADSHSSVFDRMNRMDMISNILFIMSILSKTMSFYRSRTMAFQQGVIDPVRSHAFKRKGNGNG